MPAMRIGGERHFAVQTMPSQQPVDRVSANADFLFDDEPVPIRAVENVGRKTVALHRVAGAPFRAKIRSGPLTGSLGDLASLPHSELVWKARHHAVSARGLRNQKREQNTSGDEPSHGPEDTSRAVGDGTIRSELGASPVGAELRDCSRAHCKREVDRAVEVLALGDNSHAEPGPKHNEEPRKGPSVFLERAHRVQVRAA